MFCNRCGNPVGDNDYICNNCGERLPHSNIGAAPNYQQPYQPQYQQPQYQQPQYQQPYPNYGYAQQPFGELASGKLNVGMLIWSIANLIMIWPVAVAAIVMTILANGSMTRQEELKRLRTARNLNIISTTIGVVLIIFYISVTVGIISGLPNYYI